MQAIGKLCQAGIRVQLYPDAAKLAKQFQHADKRGIPYAVLVGETEMEAGTYALKNLASGEQQNLSFDELLKVLQVK